MAILIFADVCIYAQMYKWFNGIAGKELMGLVNTRALVKQKFARALMQGPIHKMPVYGYY